MFYNSYPSFFQNSPDGRVIYEKLEGGRGLCRRGSRPKHNLVIEDFEFDLWSPVLRSTRLTLIGLVRSLNRYTRQRRVRRGFVA